ncbi:hypothetical protein BC830DRAFT_1168442 [Chytriomyces sp. MP71]|nr:hypothetical protein BC830DRAFT_1168442 [Chytriomyces sp. MP71]
MSRTSTGHFYKSTANKNGRAPDPGNGTGSGIGLWEASSANEVKAGAGLVASACIECHSRVGRCTSFGHDAAPTVQCGECQRRFHAACVGEDVVVLHGDVFYSFVCSQCSRSRLDEFARTPPTWLALTQLVLYHLTVTTPDREDRWFSWKDELCAFIDTNWDHIMIGKTRTPTWHNTIAKELSTHPDIFSSGKLHNMKGCWALVDVIPPPESKSAFAGAKKSKPSGPSSSSSKPPAKRPSSKPQPPTPAPPAPRHQHPQLSSAQKSLLRIHAFDSSDSSDEDNSTSRSATISAPPLPKLLPSKKKQKKDEAGVKEEEMRQHQDCDIDVVPNPSPAPTISLGFALYGCFYACSNTNQRSTKLVTFSVTNHAFFGVGSSTGRSPFNSRNQGSCH